MRWPTATDIPDKSATIFTRNAYSSPCRFHLLLDPNIHQHCYCYQLSHENLLHPFSYALLVSNFFCRCSTKRKLICYARWAFLSRKKAIVTKVTKRTLLINNDKVTQRWVNALRRSLSHTLVNYMVDSHKSFWLSKESDSIQFPATPFAFFRSKPCLVVGVWTSGWTSGRANSHLTWWAGDPVSKLMYRTSWIFCCIHHSASLHKNATRYLKSHPFLSLTHDIRAQSPPFPISQRPTYSCDRVDIE